MVGGRCYCGECHVSARSPALTVAYCHCADCRRWTGAAVPAFAAFASLDVTGHTNTKRHPSGVERVNCKKCGSPLSAVFPYLPDQIYVPIGIMDDIDAHAPQLHCHVASQPSWLHLPDGLAREDASARTRLAEAGDD